MNFNFTKNTYLRTISGSTRIEVRNEWKSPWGLKVLQAALYFNEEDSELIRGMISKMHKRLSGKTLHVQDNSF